MYNDDDYPRKQPPYTVGAIIDVANFDIRLYLQWALEIGPEVYFRISKEEEEGR